MSQHRRGSIHGSPVSGHPSTTVSASSISSSASHEVQTRGIPLPGMVPSRSIHASPMHGNPIHGFVNPLGPGSLVHPPPSAHVAAVSGISHHPQNIHQGTEKILPPGSPYSSHGSPLRTPMSSGHGSPQDSPHVVRHRRDSEHSSGAISRRGSSDVVSPLPEGHPLGSPDGRGRRRADYSPHQVTKLREHWDETNSKVMQRKTQLDMMLGDSKEYEAKRNAVEVWLSRMETRLERMRAVGHTADVLAMQLEEQKSFHVDLHKYKLQIELFNQLTQKLIAVYQQDDTTRVKKMTENINQRYNNLNTSIINRGKLLNSAMSSLHNFDRSLDKFLAWLSEAESSMEELEAEADRLGGRRDQGALRRPQHQLKVRSSRSC
ncbi:Dystrophin, isoform B [Ooceraea biroi]|uniref:Dystrophin, isoform B n=1 Tax=Ooceraea biroi TaxID=2015173 RepID=A0A026WJU2_OOCBI|nr:Dystrophin, isoform B [Ooceraea biroi]